MLDVPAPRLIRSKRQSIALHITPAGELVVKAPLRLPMRIIQQFIQEKNDWIIQTLEKTKRKQNAGKQYVEGETFFYLGSPYTLQFADRVTIETRENELLFPKALVFRIQKEITSWYIKQAKEKISQRVAFHAAQMNARYSSIMFSDTKSKWGTCGPEDDLQFNWRLIMAPLMVLDYVVIHELAHTKEKNHGRSFWNIVRFHTPAYRQHRNWLNKNTHLLIV
jgi:predicted metal-dependent hydrolase